MKTITQRGKVRYNWNVIRLEYQAGYKTTDPLTGVVTHTYPTHKELSTKYGCNLQYLQRKSSDEKWSESRKFFKAKYKDQATENTVKALVSESASNDAQIINRLKKVGLLVDAHLNRMDNVFSTEDGGPPSFENLDEGVNPITIKSLNEIVKLLDMSQALMRKTVGEPVTGDQQFKEFVNELKVAASKETTKDENTEEKIKALTVRKQSYQETTQSIEEELSRLVGSELKSTDTTNES